MWEQEKPPPALTVSNLADGIDCIASTLRIEHAGIGSNDYGIPSTVDGMGEVSGLHYLTAELLRQDQTGKPSLTLGRNLLRVMRGNERRGAR
jgi:membrane dipeptidase